SLYHILFLSMSPPPPRPTLFPYTTLFRSPAVPARLRRRHRSPEPGGIAPERGWGGRDRRCPAPPPHRPRHPGGHQGGRGRCRTGDRKSTRLNSSHDQISYAVFCLKKKTKT